MNIRDFKSSIIVALTYWVPSSIALLDIINDDGMLFPTWMDEILFPGYFLGFALGFGGGNIWAFVGQMISLAVIVTVLQLLKAIIQSIKTNTP